MKNFIFVADYATMTITCESEQEANVTLSEYVLEPYKWGLSEVIDLEE